MSQMPDIKPDVNVTKERKEDQGSGLLGLLSRLSGGAGGGASGGMGGLSGAAAGGGLLATKAGLIGLVLAGTTVAGGIGMVGWTTFGPGQGDRADSPALQLFASKPKEAANPFGGADAASAPKDGNSASLNYLAQANAPKTGVDAAAPAEQTAASASDAGNASASEAPHMGESAATNAAAPKTGLQNVKKLGEFSKSFGGGGSAGTAGTAAAGANPANAALSVPGSKGALGGGFAKGASSNAQSIGRGLNRARSGSATRQAMGALSDNRTAYSSQAGGRTYDGGSTSGSGASSVDAGLPTGGSGVSSDGGAQPTSTPNTAASTNESEAPPTPEGTNVTPYQNALNMAQMMLAAAGLLLYAAYYISKMEGASLGTVRIIVMALAGIAAVLSVAAIAIGAMISGGKYGQPLQGGLIALAGACMATTAATMLYSAYKADPNCQISATNMFTADTKMFMTIAGGAGMVAMAGAFLTKPKSYPSSEFEGGNAPDIGYHYQVKPEERARYTV